MRRLLVTALIDLTLLATPSRTRGIGRYAADLARALGDAALEPSGVRVRAVERFDWLGGAAIADDPGGAAARIGASARRCSHAAWAYRVRLRLAEVVRRTRPDVLHSPHPDATPLGRLGCPRIVTCHDLIALRVPAHYGGWRDGWRWGRRRLDTRRYRRADHIIAVSAATAADLVALLGVPARKITVVHHGIDTTRFSPCRTAADDAVRERRGLAERRYLLFAGGADWRKNAAGMLGALAILRRRSHTADLTLVWAGRIDPDDLARVRAQADACGVADAVRLPGYLPDSDLAALMRGAAALLFVSRIEGFGYPLVEAMACGCPVVGSDRPATIEMAGEAAVLVDPERPEAIAEAAAALLDDEPARQQAVERGVVRSRAFSLQAMAQRTAEVYRQVGAGPRH